MKDADDLIDEKMGEVRARWDRVPKVEQAKARHRLAKAIADKEVNAKKYQSMQPETMRKDRHNRFPHLPFFDLEDADASE
jgi:hypothetical protein